jgi:ubiquitin carboxyl-terminal hydrolase 36/42
MAPYISKDDKEAVKGETNYDLYAVLVHAGRSTDSGHYYAYVKSPAGKWFLMNDEDVSPVHKKVVLSEKAYMVFYKQRDSGSKGEESVMVEGLTIATEEGALKSAVKRRRDQANEQEKVVPKKKKTVQIEDLPIADDPRSWFVRCTSDAHRSLRGVMSPATYGAAMSDDSAWAVNNTKNPQTKDKKKRFHRRKRLDGKSSHFKTSNQL